MFSAILYVGVGLIIGWNFLPQPTWVKTIYDKVSAWVSSRMKA